MKVGHISPIAAVPAASFRWISPLRASDPYALPKWADPPLFIDTYSVQNRTGLREEARLKKVLIIYKNCAIFHRHRIRGIEEGRQHTGGTDDQTFSVPEILNRFCCPFWNDPSPFILSRCRSQGELFLQRLFFLSQQRQLDLRWMSPAWKPITHRDTEQVSIPTGRGGHHNSFRRQQGRVDKRKDDRS